MKVKVLKTDGRLGIKKGETYLAHRYYLDPSKVTLTSRIDDGYDPMCNQYISEIEIIDTQPLMAEHGV